MTKAKVNAQARMIYFMSWARIVAEITMILGFFIVLFLLLKQLSG